MKISVCIIGFNEEKKIEACLKSVVNIADEIIYVDSNSTDNTVKTVKKYTKKIFYKKFLGHVEQKNFAISKAKYNWVLSLDCDERLSMLAKEEIENTKGKVWDGVTAFSFPRVTFYVYRWVKHSGWYPDRKVRLFNKKQCSWGGKNPHDKIIVNHGKSVELKGDLLHYSFDSVADHIKTIQNFSEIAAQEAYEKGKRTNLFSLFFRSFWVGIRKMIFEMAFLDGGAGFIITGLSMMATFTKYSKLYMMQKVNKK